MKLKNVRASFAHVFKAKKFSGEGDSKPRYELTVLLDKEDHEEEIEAIQAKIDEARENAWPQKGRKVPQKLTSICFADGDEQGYDGYENCMVLKLARREEDGMPAMFSKSLQPVTEQSDPQACYSGCYINANVDVYAHEYGGVKRINGSLKGLQFHRHGQRLSGAAASTANDFEAEEEEMPEGEEVNPFS